MVLYLEGANGMKLEQVVVSNGSTSDWQFSPFAKVWRELNSDSVQSDVTLEPIG